MKISCYQGVSCCWIIAVVVFTQSVSAKAGYVRRLQATPTAAPTTSYFPSSAPTDSPTVSDAPTGSPVEDTPLVPPGDDKSEEPTWAPTDFPTAFPSATPSSSPTSSPTATPSSSPTLSPTEIEFILQSAGTNGLYKKCKSSCDCAEGFQCGCYYPSSGSRNLNEDDSEEEEDVPLSTDNNLRRRLCDAKCQKRKEYAIKRAKELCTDAKDKQECQKRMYDRVRKAQQRLDEIEAQDDVVAAAEQVAGAEDADKEATEVAEKEYNIQCDLKKPKCQQRLKKRQEKAAQRAAAKREAEAALKEVENELENELLPNVDDAGTCSSAPVGQCEASGMPVCLKMA
jgi:hypothetical protein